jgi:hypothetical protein
MTFTAVLQAAAASSTTIATVVAQEEESEAVAFEDITCLLTHLAVLMMFRIYASMRKAISEGRGAIDTTWLLISS